MVTDRQVRRLRMELGTGTPLSTAAIRAGMSENYGPAVPNRPAPQSASGAPRISHTPGPLRGYLARD